MTVTEWGQQTTQLQEDLDAPKFSHSHHACQSHPHFWLYGFEWAINSLLRSLKSPRKLHLA